VSFKNVGWLGLSKLKRRFSTGKTTIIALVCAAAALIYPGDVSPIMGVALAGRAASVLRDAAIWWHYGVPVTMNASTIHRTLQMESVEDDEFVAYGSIECHGLFPLSRKSFKNGPVTVFCRWGSHSYMAREAFW
jgi:AAA domain